jgi:hypothetical protein
MKQQLAALAPLGSIIHGEKSDAGGEFCAGRKTKPLNWQPVYANRASIRIHKLHTLSSLCKVYMHIVKAEKRLQRPRPPACAAQ